MKTSGATEWHETSHQSNETFSAIMKGTEKCQRKYHITGHTIK